MLGGGSEGVAAAGHSFRDATHLGFLRLMPTLRLPPMSTSEIVQKLLVPYIYSTLTRGCLDHLRGGFDFRRNHESASHLPNSLVTAYEDCYIAPMQLRPESVSVRRPHRQYGVYAVLVQQPCHTYMQSTSIRLGDRVCSLSNAVGDGG